MKFPLTAPSYYTEKEPHRVTGEPLYLSDLMEVYDAYKGMTEIVVSDSSPSPILWEPAALFSLNPNAEGEEGKLLAVIAPKEPPLPIYETYRFEKGRARQITELEELRSLEVRYLTHIRLVGAVFRAQDRFWIMDTVKVGPLTLIGENQGRILYHVFPTVLHWQIDMK